jgi:hypothetical protein
LILAAATALSSGFGKTVQGGESNSCAQNEEAKLRLIKKAEENE